MNQRLLLRGAALAVLCPLGVTAAQGLGFTAQGPVNQDHGYPQWYEDTNGVRLDLCLETNGLCLVEGPSQVTNPALPFPANFGGGFTPESFYNLAEASMETNNGGQALLVIALEAAFDPEVIADGNQVVFSRFRLRVDNLVAGAAYEVTTPVGTFEFVAEGSGVRSIDFTDDVGRLAGAFDGALGSTMVGPFLMWDSELPITDAAGRQYLGDPGVPHTITGSPYGTNLFRIRGQDVGGPGVDEISTDLFSVSGVVSEAFEPAPPGPVRLTVAPALAGRVNRVRMTGGTEGGLAVFLFGFRPRTGAIVLPGPLCAGGVLDIRDPMFLGFGTTFLGSASLSELAPASLRNERLVFQTIDLASCLISDPVQVRFR